MATKRAQRNMVLAQRTLQQVEATERRESWHARIHADLAARGIPSTMCDAIAAKLGAHAHFDELSAEAYRAMIDGAVLACGARNPEEREAPDVVSDPAEVREIERMMQAFAGELRKLDESLEVLSAYVQRMRKRPDPPREPAERVRRTLH
ncbi:MAG: hypothetical protein QF570_01995 [Myxococcota bacterium]|jgi:hypothetical protein|nr:hypothetical protein [Myxococcota bacterium]